jgi:hypothetical protein
MNKSRMAWCLALAVCISAAHLSYDASAAFVPSRYYRIIAADLMRRHQLEQQPQLPTQPDTEYHRLSQRLVADVDDDGDDADENEYDLDAESLDRSETARSRTARHLAGRR